MTKIRSKSTISFRKTIFLLNSLLVFFSILLITLLWIVSEVKSYKEDIGFIRSQAVLKQKNALEKQVAFVFNYIHFMQNYHGELLEKDIKNEILHYVAEIRFEYGGYVFINQTDGTPLVFDGNIVQNPVNIKDMTDPTGLRIFDLEIALSSKPEGGFMEYYLKKMDSETPEPKISFIKGYPQWNWIIGAGNYKDDVSSELKYQKQRLIKGLYQKIGIILLLFIGISFAIFYLANYSSKLFQQQIKLINNLFYKSLKLPEYNNTLYQPKIILKEISFFIDKFEQLLTRHKETENLKNEIEEKFSKAFYDQIIPISLINLKEQTRIDVNESFLKFFEYSREEIVGKSVSDAEIWIDLEQKEEVYVKLIAQNFVQNIEAKMRTKRGAIKTLLINAVKMKVDDGNLAIVSLVDITPQKIAEEALNHHKAQLENLVNERTKELVEKNEELEQNVQELERFNNLFVEREFRIKELRDEVNALKGKLKNNL